MLVDPGPETQTPYGRVEGPEAPAGTHEGAQANLLEQIISREHMRLAWNRVKANQGAAGTDGMSIDAWPECARQPWKRAPSARQPSGGILLAAACQGDAR